MRRAITLSCGAALTTAAIAAANLVATPTAWAECGEEYRTKPASSAIPGGPPLAIGDSVLADAVPLLAHAGFEADGMVCRQMSQGIELLRARDGRLPHLVVLALGTNGDVTAADIDAALEVLGPDRILALVTPHGSVVPSSPQVIRQTAAEHPGQILLLDWDRLVQGHPEWLAPDGVHLGGAAGIDAYAQLIESAYPYATRATTEIPASAETASPVKSVGAPITIAPSDGHQEHEPKQAKAQPTVAPAPTPHPTAPATARGSTNPTDANSSDASPALIVGAAIVVLALAGVWSWRRRT